MNDLYEFTVEWPSTTAQSVIVTGDFDKWSKSLQLSRSAKDTFAATIKVPYGCPTRYKFIVDGEWVVKRDQPTEHSPEGYLNNIHYVPLEAPPALKVSVNTKEENKNESPDQSLGITDLKDTIVASAGTSGALAYVASGIGETVRSVVGVDPFSSNQIAIPTPISPNPSTGFPSLVANAPADATTPNTDSATSTTGPAESASITPLIPLGIVPSKAKEDCTINVQEAVKKEEGEDTEISPEIQVPSLPRSNIPIIATESSTSAKEIAKVEALKEEGNTITEADLPLKEASPPPQVELAPITASELAVKAKAPVPEEPLKKADETVPTSSVAPVITAEPTTNGHVQDPSSTSTKVASSSRPTTPTHNSAPVESITSSPVSTVRKSKIFQLGKGSSFKGSTEGGSTDEFGVQDGKDTIGKKKRKSSFFKSLKKLFHHEHHEKDKEKAEK